MPSQFEYSGVDRSGRQTDGVLEGESPLDVVLHLKRSGVTVYSIKKKLLPEDRSLGTGRKISASNLIAFNTQLSSLLKTKLPLAESLRHLSKEMRSARLKSVTETMAKNLEAGGSFSESVAEYAGYFPPLYVSMVIAGEKTGVLAETLFRAANHFKSIDDFKRKLLNMMVYPALVLIVAMAVLVFLVKVMVPPYIDMYSGFHKEFPTSLQFLVSLEGFLSNDTIWMVFAPAIVVMVGVFVYIVRRNQTLQAYRGHIVIRIPVWGEMIKHFIFAQTFSTLAVLLQSGTPMRESLDIVKDLISNWPLSRALAIAAEEVAEGDPLSQPLLKDPLFPLDLAWLIRNGEIKGDMIGSLENASRMCRSKFDFTSRLIFSIMEPILFFAVGAVVVAIAVSLFYPLYTLSQHLGG